MLGVPHARAMRTTTPTLTREGTGPSRRDAPERSTMKILKYCGHAEMREWESWRASLVNAASPTPSASDRLLPLSPDH